MDDAKVDFDPFRGGEIARTAPSTEPQREIITSAMMSPEGNTAFNEAVSLRIRGPLDTTLLEEALRMIAGRHDALRMTFTRAGDQLCVTDENRFALELRDLAGEGDEEAVEQAVQAVWRELAAVPMDLFDGPLFRAVLVRRGRDDAELILLAHHVICDGWSFYVMLKELAALLSTPDSATAAGAAKSFAEFAEREAAHAASNADIDFWVERFRNLPPPLELPTDRPRPALRSFAAERTDFTFDAALTAAVKATAGKIRASVVNVALAGFAVLLHKLCKVEDVVIGLPVARQSTDNLHDLVGHGVQLLPIRLSVQSDEPFADVVARAKSAVLDAQEHPDFTFGTLVRELGLSGDGSRVPLISVIFNIDQPMGQLTLGGAQATVRTVPRVAENFEIFLNVMPAAESLVVEATYNTDLFDEGSMRAWLSALRSILADVAGDPQKAVSKISLADALLEPYRQLNDTARRHDGNTWLEGLARHCVSTAGSIAACDRSTRLSYGELDARSTQLAHALRRRGIGRGDLVGLYMTRSVELLVAVAAVHKAGAGYLPLDPAFPESRIAFMLEDSEAKLLLADCDLPGALQASGIARLRLPLPPEGDLAGDLPVVSAEDVAYVIYTSGSTGQPKGVRVHHGAVLNFLHAMASKPGMTAEDRLLAVTTLSFDISVLELLLPLFCGGSVYVADREQAGDARALEQLLTDERISIMQATPASWRLLLGHGWTGNSQLQALCGGEPLALDVARQLAGRVRALWNMYGPTETTIWSTCQRIAADCERITIGTPIDNTRVYIVGEQGGLMPPAVPGELCIGGAGVSKGYLGRPVLTAEKFVQDPQLGLVYRTGDRARLLPNGEIEHLGRIDDQVKVRGFRIELGEIEAALQDHADIDRAAVHVWNVKNDDARIVACCILAEGKTIAPIQLRKHLRARLPEYMIPQHFLRVEAIPVTPNGKIDRKSLPIPVVADSRIGRHEAPAGPVEAAIADIWTALVRPERPIGRNDRFFEIGGHSLLGLEALQRMEERLGVRLHPRILFQENLAGIAGRCGAAAQAEASAVSRPAPLPAHERRLLSDNQELIYGEVRKSLDTLQFHIPFSFRMSGPLDVSRFEASLRQVFALHAALRTVVGQDAAGPYLDLLAVEQACRLERHDLGSEPDGDAAAFALMIAETKTPFDVRKGPLVRMHLIRLAPAAHVFLFMPHQLVFDGWSFDLFLRDLAHCYAGGPSAQPGASLAFSDYSTWQRKNGDQPSGTPAAAFWREQLQNAPAPAAWPGAATPAESALTRVQFTIPVDRMRDYEHACKQQGVKLPNFVLAAFVRTLAAATAQNDVLLGVANSGRFLPETATIVGPFYRNLPFRLRIPKHCSTGALLELVERTVEKATEFQDVSCGTLAAIAGSPDALVSLGKIAFSFQEARTRRLEFADIELKQISVSRPGMQSDLEFWVRNTPDGLIASLDYRSELADRELVEAIRDDFTRMLGTLAESGPMDGEFRSQSRLAGDGGRSRPKSAQGGGLLRRFGKKASAG